MFNSNLLVYCGTLEVLAKCEDEDKIDLKNRLLRCSGNQLTHNRVQWPVVVQMVMKLRAS